MQIVFLVEDKKMPSCSLAYSSGKQDSPKQVQFPGEET